jgi:hypothetical protein
LDELDTGDLERDAATNGEEDKANASNPVRFAAVDPNEDGSPRPDENGEKGEVAGGLAENGGGDVAGLLEEKMFWPLTEANGELEDA